MRALITGGHGFAGRYLAQHLVSCGDDVAVTYNPQNKAEETRERPRQASFPQSVQAMALDVTNKKAVSDLISLIRPDVIYHLAAITFVPAGELDFDKVFDVNFRGSINLLEAVGEHSKASRVMFASSAEVYGDPRPGSLPLNELAVLRPVTLYGIAKSAADLAAFKYSFTDGIHVIRVRPFPHIGPGQDDHFAISSFAKQLAAIKLGKAEPKLMVGNLEAKRDFSDVSDIVRGYREAVLNGKRGEVYNLCSGSSIAVGEVLQKLIKIAEVEVEIEVDPARLRNIDIPDTYGDYSKAQKDFGWKPRIDLEGTLHSLLAYWLEVLGA